MLAKPLYVRVCKKQIAPVPKEKGLSYRYLSSTERSTNFSESSGLALRGKFWIFRKA